MSIDNLTGKLAEIVSAMQGPGFEAAKGAASMDALSTLMSGALCGVAASASAWGFRRAWVRHKTVERGDIDAEMYSTLGMFLCGCAAVMFGIPAIWAIADPWTWTALMQPELWLAKRALGL